MILASASANLAWIVLALFSEMVRTSYIAFR
jgi:hypothetical protein